MPHCLKSNVQIKKTRKKISLWVLTYRTQCRCFLSLRRCDRNLYRSIFLFHPHFHTYKTYYSPGCLQSYGIFGYVLLLSLQSAEMLLPPQRILPVSLHLQMPDTHPPPLPAHYVLTHATAEPESSSHLPDNFHQ